jgi:hypothetical protein
VRRCQRPRPVVSPSHALLRSAAINLCPCPMNPRKVGDKIRVSMQMHGGEIVDATIKPVIETISDRQYQIDFGKGQTATVTEQQIVKQ